MVFSPHAHSSAYIVPADFMSTVTFLGGLDSPAFTVQNIPADPTRALVVITWDNENAKVEFEARPEVLALGAPWEPLPAELSPLLASLADPAFEPNAQLTALRSNAMLALNAPVQSETVHSALQKTSIGRSVR